MSEQTSKTHTDSAHLLRAIERGIVYDRLPAPTAVNIQPEYGSAKLRFATAEDVHEWAQLTGATVVTGPYVYREGTDSPWHEVGTEQDGKPGELVGWQVSIWASVDGLPPAPQPEPAEPEQEWLFTFGAGQQHDGRFVRITGTYDTARSRMNLVFGHAWCAQYDWQRFDEEGLPARVTELPESEWPPHAEAAQAAAEPEHHARHDGACWSSCPTCHPEAVEVRTQRVGE